MNANNGTFQVLHMDVLKYSTQNPELLIGTPSKNEFIKKKKLGF